MRGIVLSFLFIITSANAATITTKVHDIIKPSKSESKFLILATSGDVFELDESNTEALEAAYFSLEENILIDINLVDLSLNKILGMRENISKINMANTPLEIEEEGAFDTEIPTPLDNYELTSIWNMDDANKLFRSQRTRTRRRSQCYNRAHVWTYELKKRGVNSGKVWLFFTKRYIKEYKYKWWFHVAPYITVKGEEEETVMDREFTRTPKTLTDWKNIFMKNNAPCPTVEYYSDYRDHFWNGSKFCYFIKSSMYYWQPFDIEKLEQGEAQRTEWNKNQLEQAYRNAIKGWNGELR